MPDIVQYKGRSYRLLFKGKTKFGFKAKLAFMDGSKEFWVDANLISESTKSTRAPGRGEHHCRNGHDPHPGPCCSGRHGGGYDCGADCCELD